MSARGALLTDFLKEKDESEGEGDEMQVL